MDKDTAARLGLGAFDQVGFVVEDMDRALPRYEALYGPFRVGEAPLQEVTFRGKVSDCKLKLALNTQGPVEIELIQVLEGDSPHSEHIREHGEGLHHIRFCVPKLDEALEKLEAEGYETIFFKRFGPNLAFSYSEAREGPKVGVIELLESP
jgi:methylmalonyl-CoA/ethylmalonyl-CoA epimerase